MAGTTLFTYGPSNVDSLLSTTLSAIRKTLADNIFTRIPLFMFLNSKGKITESGGASVVIPVMYGKNATAANYSGYGIIDTTPQEGASAAQFSWKQYAGTVSISGLEETQNSGEKAIIKLLEAKVKQCEMSLRDRLDIDMFASSTVGTKILALPAIVDTTTSIGDISKSSNSWWQAQVTASGSFNARGLADMRNIYNTIVNQDTNGGAPNFIVSTQSVYEFYESTLQPQMRFSDNKMADAGFENLKYKGAVMTYDGNCPSGNLFMLNSDHLQLVVASGRDFINTPFIKPTNQDARVSQILWMGALVSDNIRRLGKLTGITA